MWADDEREGVFHWQPRRRTASEIDEDVEQRELMLCLFFLMFLLVVLYHLLQEQSGTSTLTAEQPALLLFNALIPGCLSQPCDLTVLVARRCRVFGQFEQSLHGDDARRTWPTQCK